MKKIVYGAHLKFRLKLRGIPYDLPREIYETSRKHYFDRQTFKSVAIKSVYFKDKMRQMVVVYEEINKQVNLITIHPLKNHQKINRINTGRWKKL